MDLVNNVKPISYLKTNAARIASDVKGTGEPYLITQNGEAVMVVQSVAEYQRMQNTIAMLQIAASGQNEITQDKTQDAKQAIREIKEKYGLGI
jgi:prevent-host-death family protein